MEKKMKFLEDYKGFRLYRDEETQEIYVNYMSMCVKDVYQVKQWIDEVLTD